MMKKSQSLSDSSGLCDGVDSSYQVLLKESLKKRHVGEEKVQQALLQSLMIGFITLQMKDDDTMDAFTAKLNGYATKAKELGKTLDESLLVRKLLDSTPDRFIQIVASIEQTSDLDDITLDEITRKLKAFEEKIKLRKGGQDESQENLLFAEGEHSGKGRRFSKRGDIRAIGILIAIAAYYDYEIWQMDVKTAFLNGRLDEDIYMEQLEWYVDPKYPNRNPKKLHWVVVKHILKYLRNTRDMFLVYGGKPDTKLDVTAQAEYIAASEAAMEAVWIRKFVRDLGVMPSINKPINMYCDNSEQSYSPMNLEL
nr:zinc finger, CCHC-type [Tanacetum cinerariifolium]